MSKRSSITLRGRTVAGAAADVSDTEPLRANFPFRSLQHLLATPHIESVVEDLYRTFCSDAAAAISLQTRAPATKVMDRSLPACAGVWTSRPTKMACSINGSVPRFSALTIRPNYSCRVLEGGKNGVPRYWRAIYLVVDQERAQCHAAFDSTSSAVRMY